MSKPVLKPTGTVKGILTWIRQQRAGEVSTVDLVAMPLEGPTVIVSWPFDEATRDVDTWAALVLDMAQDDAEARGASTKYELRHVRDGRQAGVMPLRRVVERIEQSDDDAPQVNDVGSMMGTFARMLDAAHRQVIESSRVAMQAAQSANETQRASLAMLSQAYTIIATQQNALALQAEEARAVQATPPAEKSGLARAGDEAVGTLMQIAAAKYGPRIIEQVLGPMMADDDEPTATQ